MKTIRSCLAFLCLFVAALNSKIEGAAITWTNTQGGLWSAATNWSPNQVPSTNDTALITTPGSYTVATDQTNYVLNLTIGASGSASTQTLLFTNYLAVGSNTVVQGGGLFEITNAISFTCHGSVTVTSAGVLTEYAGFLSYYFLTPALIITNGGVVNAIGFPSTFDSFLGISFPAETFDASVIVAKGGILNASQGTFSYFNVESGGTVNASSESFSALSTNAGTINLTNVTFASSSFETEPSVPAFINLPGGVVNLYETNFLSEAAFTNLGTIVQHSGFSTLYTADFTPATGTISNLDGLMTIEYFGTNLGGKYFSGNSAVIDFKGNDESQTYTNNNTSLDPNLALNGPGQFAVTSGYLVLPYSVPANLQLLSDTVSLGPDFQGGSITNLTIVGTPNVTLATTYLNTDLPITGTLIVSNAAYFGPVHIERGGVLDVYPRLVYDDAFQKLLVDVGGTANFYGAMLDYGDWTNFGTLNFNDAHLDIATNLINQPGATIFMNGPGGVTLDFTNSTFKNLGVLIHDAPGVTNNISYLLNPGASEGVDNSRGVITNLAGGLSLESLVADSLTGSYYSALGATIQFSGRTNPPFTLGSPLSLGGPGQYQFIGGDLYLSNTVPPNLALTGGFLQLGPNFQGGVITNLTLGGIIFSNTSAKPIIIAGPVSVINSGLSGYYLSDNGIYTDIIITNHGILNSTNSVFFGKISQTNGGELNLCVSYAYSNILVGPDCIFNSLAVYSYSSVTVDQGGTLNCIDDGLPGTDFYISSLDLVRLTNAGTISFTNSSIALIEDPDATNSSGIVNLPTGVIQIWGRSGLDGETGYILNQGEIVSSSTNFSGIEGLIGTNSGTIISRYSPVVIAGNWTLLPSSALSVQLNGPTNYGSFIFATNLSSPTASGLVHLTGSFTASLGNGYVPASGTSFDVVSYSEETGAFSQVNPPAAGKWNETYGLSGFILTLDGGLPAFSSVGETGNGSSLSFSGGGGNSGSKFQILATTNLALPVVEWTSILTNAFDANGNFQFEITPPNSSPHEYYLLKLP